MSNILIVEDDANVRDLLRRILEGAGHEVVEAPNAEDAMSLLRGSALSVAFVDVHMPGASGLWLAEQIRHSSPATAVVLATGDARILPAESLRSGVVAYIVKPFTRKDILSAADAGIAWSANAQAGVVTRHIPAQLDSGIFED